MTVRGIDCLLVWVLGRDCQPTRPHRQNPMYPPTQCTHPAGASLLDHPDLVWAEDTWDEDREEEAREMVDRQGAALPAHRVKWCVSLSVGLGLVFWGGGSRDRGVVVVCLLILGVLWGVGCLWHGTHQGSDKRNPESQTSTTITTTHHHQSTGTSAQRGGTGTCSTSATRTDSSRTGTTSSGTSLTSCPRPPRHRLRMGMRLG